MKSSVPLKAPSTAQPGPELHTENGPDVFEGIEGQIALDSFLSGRSERPLMELLARVEGLNIDDCLEFGGAVDQLVDLDDHYGFLNNNIKSQFEPAAAQEQDREISDRDQQLVAARSTATNVSSPEPTPLQRASLGYIEPDEIFKSDDLPTDVQHFRLLGRGPPDEHGNISSLTLHTFDINDAPPFYAISYVWHDPELEVSMTCDNKKLMIRNSLGSALEKLVPWSRGTYLWADGICINQGNIAERNHQVTLMGNLYGHASKVLAHLGGSGPTEDDSSDWSAVNLMNLTNRLWLNEPNPSSRSDSEWMRVLAINHDNAALWKSLVSFWMNPWFTRCWIMQEAVLADDVVLLYGKAICSLNAVTTFWDLVQRHELPAIMRYSSLADIYRACRNRSLVGSFKRLRELHKEPSVTGATLESLRQLREDGGNHKVTGTKDHRFTSDSLCGLLAMSRRSKNATDERDKVYALLALAQDGLAKTVQPDYSTENTVSKVFCDVAEESVRQGYGVELLHYSGKDHVIEGLPSWVPNWSQQTRSTFHSTQYCCATFSQPKITLSPKPGHLHVRRAIIDSFEYLGYPCRFYSFKPSEDRLYPELMDNNDEFPPVESDLHRRQVIYATPKMFDYLCSTDQYADGLDSAMARTLTADCTWTGERTGGDPAYMEGFAAFSRFNEWSLQMSVLSKPVEPDPEEARLLDEAWPYECALQDVHNGRRICVTKGRYMGITTYDTEKGDLLVMFEGFAMPFVLRPKGDNFEIIGDCYIHGIMDGELACVPKAKFGLDASQQGVDKYGDEFYVWSLTGGLATLQTFTIV